MNGATASIGEAAVVREGGDVTVVSAMRGVHESLAAAEQLAAKGIDAEVIDLRTIRPLDAATVLGSVAKTNRLVVVEEGPLTGGWAGEVAGGRGRAGARAPRRRVADRHARLADPLQSTSRGRAHSRRGPHRLRDRATVG